MGVTVSTHNGSAAHRGHNIRDEKTVKKQKHIKENGVHEIWIDEAPRKAYDRIFGDAVKEYNASQKRPERRIKDYYNKVRDTAKKHPVYEMIIGVYGQNKDGSLICDEKQSKEILKQFVDNWHERNPNLELIGAYYHADEESKSPHVHLDYVPVAHGYQKGMHTQSGLAKALGEQGFKKDGKMTAQIQWEQRENEYLTKLCEDRGFIVDHPKIEGIKHLETSEYKLQQSVKGLQGSVESLRAATAAADQQLEGAVSKLKPVIEVAEEADRQMHEPRGFLKRPKREIDENTANAIETVAKLEPILKEYINAPAMLEQLRRERQEFEEEKAKFERERKSFENSKQDFDYLVDTKAEEKAIEKADELAEIKINDARQQLQDEYSSKEKELQDDYRKRQGNLRKEKQDFEDHKKDWDEKFLKERNVWQEKRQYMLNSYINFMDYLTVMHPEYGIKTGYELFMQQYGNHGARYSPTKQYPQYNNATIGVVLAREEKNKRAEQRNSGGYNPTLDYKSKTTTNTKTDVDEQLSK